MEDEVEQFDGLVWLLGLSIDMWLGVFLRKIFWTESFRIPVMTDKFSCGSNNEALTLRAQDIRGSSPNSPTLTSQQLAGLLE